MYQVIDSYNNNKVVASRPNYRSAVNTINTMLEEAVSKGGNQDLNRYKVKDLKTKQIIGV